ncbi:MAG: DUF4097 family beta strand repeat-containing protein [Armatimonadetes bacterium]|nr:DUF4097 family beta strand repeat-containing protein [Armatimonadota bacterium]
MFQCPCRGSAFFAALIASLVAFGVLSCSSKIRINRHDKKVSERFEKTFTAKEVDALKIKETDGTVQVTLAPKEQEEIGIIAEKVVTGETSEDMLRKNLSKIHVTAVLKERTLVVESSWEGEKPKGINSSVSYRITVPARLMLDITTQSGDVKADGITGGIKVSSENGEIELKKTQGTHELSTSNGSIRLRDVFSSAPLTLSSVDGQITATNLKAPKVTAKTVNGDVDIETNAPILNLASTNGEVAIKLSANTEVKNLKAQTTNGYIKLTLPKNTNANLKAHVSNGSVKLEESGKTQEADKELEKTLGSGGGTLDLKTENGEVEVRLK